jgi:tetratricopeptide (TPR) repeat protein
VARSKQALELMTALHHGDFAHPKVIDAAMYYGNALQFVGDFDAAAVVIASAVDQAVATFGEDNRLVAELHSHLVIADLERGNLAGALRNSRRSIEIYLKEAQPGTPLHAYRLRLLGHSLLAARAGGEAVERLDEAVRVSIAANSAAGATSARASLGMALAFVGRFEEAQLQLQQTMKDSRPGTRPHHQAQRHLGTLLKLQGRYAESVPWFDRSIAAAVEPNHRGDLAIAWSEAGQAQLELGNLEAAQLHFTRAETLFSELQKNYTTPARADLWIGSARLYMQRRDYQKALQLTQQADRFWRDFNADSRWAGEAALWLGRCYLALGRSADAHAALRRAETVLSRSPLPGDSKLMLE